MLENVPSGQAVQPLSVVAEPSEETYRPGSHTDHDVHGVAALASWSQVPGAQADLSNLLPGQ